jgi:hypothetical protein
MSARIHCPRLPSPFVRCRSLFLSNPLTKRKCKLEAKVAVSESSVNKTSFLHIQRCSCRQAGRQADDPARLPVAYIFFFFFFFFQWDSPAAGDDDDDGLVLLIFQENLGQQGSVIFFPSDRVAKMEKVYAFVFVLSNAL